MRNAPPFGLISEAAPPVEWRVSDGFVPYEAALAADSTYGKAAASLARVTPHVEGDTSTVDLAALATEFQAEVQRWRQTTVEVVAQQEDSTAE